MKFGEGAIMEKIHEVIFEADTKAGKLFDVLLLIIIILSVATVLIESVPSVQVEFSTALTRLEWIFTILFSIEYIARILATKKPKSYIFSFFGIIDLLSILPAFLGIFLDGGHYLLTIRALRLLRVFRIFKLAHFVVVGDTLLIALKQSSKKITVFLLFVLMLTTFIGSLMYLIEVNQDSGFTSIPRSIYWAIVTVTTVGYGDIAPTSSFGQLVAAFMMLIGYAIIAVPTGIVGAEIVQAHHSDENFSTQVCPHCSNEGHSSQAEFCYKCGEAL